MSETVVCFLLKVEEGAASGEAYTDSGDLARLIGRASTPLAGVVANIPQSSSTPLSTSPWHPLSRLTMSRLSANLR